MGYGTYATKLNSASSNLTSKNENILDINFDSTWEGKAHDKQIEHRTELTNTLNKVIADLEALSKALQEIEQYDTIKTQKEKWEKELNNTPREETSRRENASANLAEVKIRLNDKKNQINSLLSSISTTYSSNLTTISPTELISTNDIFATVFSSSSSISQALEVSQYVETHANFSDTPNFNNRDAWVNVNPYSQAGLYGQCTWFAWGKFYETYGYSPGFTGNGNQCAGQLVNSHPDKFELSDYPKSGAVFSYKGYPYGHTGFVTEVKDGMITIQDGNYDGVTNSFAVAQNDWGTRTMTVDQFIGRYGGNIVFANPKNTVTL